MEHRCKVSGVKRIRIHDIHHSHVSLLIEMSFSALDGAGARRMPCENSARRRSKTMAFRCTPEEHKLICGMATWSGMSSVELPSAKLTDTQVVVKSSVGVQKALKDSMAELAKEVRRRPPTAS